MSLPEGTPWVGAAEMGDFAFCPRSHHYGATRGEAGREDPRSRAGERYHARSLAEVRELSEHRAGYAALAVVALLLAAGVAYLALRGG